MFDSLPDITTIPFPFALIDVCVIPIAGIVAELSLEAVNTFTFSPVSPLEYTGTPAAIVEACTFLTVMIKSSAVPLPSALTACEALLAFSAKVA